MSATVPSLEYSRWASIARWNTASTGVPRNAASSGIVTFSVPRVAVRDANRKPANASGGTLTRRLASTDLS